MRPIDDGLTEATSEEKTEGSATACVRMELGRAVARTRKADCVLKGAGVVACFFSSCSTAAAEAEAAQAAAMMGTESFIVCVGASRRVARWFDEVQEVDDSWTAVDKALTEANSARKQCEEQPGKVDKRCS